MDSIHHRRLPRILMLPWLGHGHVSPFLELAKRLVSHNNSFHVIICSTPVNLGPLRQITNLPSSIEFIDLNLPSSPQLPPDHHSTRNLPPHLMPVLKTAFDEAKDAFHGILSELKPDLVIYDFLQPWAASIAQTESIPAVLFLTTSAVTSAFLYHHTRYDHPVEEDYPISGFGFRKPVAEQMVQFMFDEANGVTNKERYFQCINNSSRFILIKTVNEIENTHLNYLSELVNKEVVPVGLLVQGPERNLTDSASSFMEWLDQKELASAVFVSFGTEYSLSIEEIQEVAYALELSMVSFIWVVRFHVTANITTVQEMLPDVFLQRVGDRGMVVEGWAPQAKMLRHTSIGGFVSHCGWSSTLESISCGVPIIAVPMHLDQPLNARLVAEIGAGIEVPRENGRFRKEELARVIREVVVEENGGNVRKKVKEMSATIMQKGDLEVDHAVKMLMRLLGK